MSTRFGKRRTFWSDVNVAAQGEGFPATMLSRCNAVSPMIQNMPDLASGLVQNFLYGSCLVICNDAVRCRMDLLNGCDRSTINKFSYITNAPGSFAFPFRKNFFLFTINNAATHPNYPIINHFRNLNQGMGLAVNGMCGRTIYLARCTWVTFTYLPANATAGITIDQTNQLDPHENFIYFSVNPVGGRYADGLNDSVPPILQNTVKVYPGGDPVNMFVGISLPPVFFYQSATSPGMGGIVVVLDQDMENSCDPIMPVQQMAADFGSCVAAGNCAPGRGGIFA